MIHTTRKRITTESVIRGGSCVVNEISSGGRSRFRQRRLLFIARMTASSTLGSLRDQQHV
jgi:hypothetical protein